MQQFQLFLLRFFSLCNKVPSAKYYLPKVLRNDLIFQIASSNDHMSLTNLHNVRLNNSGGADKDTKKARPNKTEHQVNYVIIPQVKDTGLRTF